MVTQASLFDFAPHPRHRHTDPPTSQAANPDRGVPALILETMRTEPAHAWTADELASRIRAREDTLRSALSRLKGAGKVRVVGEGRSRSGRRMQTFREA